MSRTVPIEDKWFYAAGVVLAIGSAVAAFIVGWRIPTGETMLDYVAGAIMGSGLACVTVIVARLLKKIDERVSAGDLGRAGVMAIVWLAFLGTEIITTTTFHAGERTANVQQAMVRDDAVLGAGKSVAENEELMTVMQKQLADMKAANGWVAAVTADALRAKVDAAQKKIDLETARGGCKSICLADMQEKADLEGRIKIAETTEDLTGRIASTQKVLADSRTKVASMDRGDSKVLNTAQLWASTFTRTLTPSKDALQWTVIGQSGWLGVIFSLGAAIAFWLAGGKTENRPVPRPEVYREAAAPVTQPSAEPVATAAKGLREIEKYLHILGVNPAMPGVTHMRSQSLAA